MTVFLHLPWFGFAALKACVGARVGWVSEADLIPRTGVRVVGFQSVLHQKLPETPDRHLFPDFFPRNIFAIVQSLKDEVLLTMRKVDKFATESRLRFFLNGLLAEPICLAVRWHLFITVSDAPILIEPFVERLNNWNATLGCSVMLGKEVIENCSPEAALLNIKVMEARWPLYAHSCDIACSLVPIRLLRHGAEAAIVAGLIGREQRLARGCVAR